MTMDIIDKRIYSCNEAICKNIESLQANERGLLSQNILSQLRNFLECVFLKIYVASGNSLISTSCTLFADGAIRLPSDGRFIPLAAQSRSDKS